MSEIDTFKDKLDQRVKVWRDGRAKVEAEFKKQVAAHPDLNFAPPLGSPGEMHAHIAEFASWLDERIKGAGAESGRLTSAAAQPLAAAPLPKPDPKSAALAELLHYDEQVMLNRFDLARLPPCAGFNATAILVESDSEFKREVEAAVGKVQWARAVPAAYLPGRGCLLNMPVIRRLALEEWDGESDAPEKVKVRYKALEWLALEKWGWGFFLEYSGLGKFLLAGGHWQEATRLRLQGTALDGARGAAASALRSSTLTRLGWSFWIRDYMLFEAAHKREERLVDKINPGKVLSVMETLSRAFENVWTVYALSNAIWLILLQTQLPTFVAHKAVQTVQNHLQRVDDFAVRAWHENVSTQFAALLFMLLETKVGKFCMPYAVLIAAYVKPNGNGGDLETEAFKNVDTRFALLSSIDPRTKYNKDAMAVAAWEEVELDSPQEYFRD
jgi:hypothetical protein